MWRRTALTGKTRLASTSVSQKVSCLPTEYTGGTGFTFSGMGWLGPSFSSRASATRSRSGGGGKEIASDWVGEGASVRGAGEAGDEESHWQERPATRRLSPRSRAFR